MESLHGHALQPPCNDSTKRSRDEISLDARYLATLFPFLFQQKVWIACKTWSLSGRSEVKRRREESVLLSVARSGIKWIYIPLSSLNCTGWRAGKCNSRKREGCKSTAERSGAIMLYQADQGPIFNLLKIWHQKSGNAGLGAFGFLFSPDIPILFFFFCLPVINREFVLEIKGESSSSTYILSNAESLLLVLFRSNLITELSFCLEKKKKGLNSFSCERSIQGPRKALGLPYFGITKRGKSSKLVPSGLCSLAIRSEISLNPPNPAYREFKIFKMWLATLPSSSWTKCIIIIVIIIIATIVETFTAIVLSILMWVARRVSE